MTHEKTYEEEVRAIAPDGLLPSERRARALASTGQRYRCKHGDLWVRQGDNDVVRLSDGNIGGWMDGRGLVEVEH